jgi:ActR/RegA family two-component response regulator
VYRVLLIDEDCQHAEQLSGQLQRRGVMVSLAKDVLEAEKQLRRTIHAYEVVILILADRSKPWLSILRRMLEASRQRELPIGPLFLCVSRIAREAEFQLQIEGMGARYVLER